MLSPFSLEGKVALITGGGTGLGFGIAQAMVNAGAHVAITGRRKDLLDDAAAVLGAHNVLGMAGDVTSPNDRGRWLSQAYKIFGKAVNILVNNAGNHLKKPAVDITDAEFASVMNVHVNAAFALSREAAPEMLRAGNGSILFIASMASYMGVPKVAAYTAAKCAVAGLTRALAAEWSASGVRVNAIAPGWIESPMTLQAFESDPARKQKVLSRTPLGRMGFAPDIGLAAVYLCSPAAAFITGQVIPVDGGASIGF